MTRYEVREAHSDDGSSAGFYYVLIASNGEVLTTSETYTRREDAQRGILAHEQAAADAKDQIEGNHD